MAALSNATDTVKTIGIMSSSLNFRAVSVSMFLIIAIFFLIYKLWVLQSSLFVRTLTVQNHVSAITHSVQEDSVF